MKKILVPIDFSRASIMASEYAASLAQLFGAEIQLLHIYMEPVPATEGAGTWAVTSSLLKTENETSLRNQIDLLRKKYSVAVNGKVTPGFKGDSIKAAAQDMKADLIVMGMKTGRTNKLLRSTVLKMIRKTSLPVLVIPETAAYHKVRDIVLAVDFGQMSDSASLEPLFSLIKKFDATLHVLHVEEKGADIKVSEVPEKVHLGLVLSKITYLYDKIESDDVEQGIQNFVQNHPADMLVMIAHHHNIFERIFGQVYTQDISFDLNLPLLVLKK